MLVKGVPECYLAGYVYHLHRKGTRVILAHYIEAGKLEAKGKSRAQLGEHVVYAKFPTYFQM